MTTTPHPDGEPARSAAKASLRTSIRLADALGADRVAQEANVGREVRAGQAEAADLDRSRHSTGVAGFVDECAQSPHAGLDRHLLMGDGLAVDERQEGARPRDEREVGL